MTDEELGLRKINTPSLQARTLKGNEVIDYELLLRDDGRLYVRLLKNSGSGGISKYRFGLDTVPADLKDKAAPIRGIAPDGIFCADTNLNSKGFVQAVVNHLLRISG